MPTECPQLKENLVRCNCTWEPCERKGNCCACISYHWKSGELPACLFPDDVERTYDRSIRRFVQLHS
ncbi:MAG: hypothetical protein AMS15_05045 [Planctomycetes bacterium DG_23]|nr:MAG: hypothetical protein AMS15_05045 [Planctomycetes bacterium DG_23]